jgi:hypothetical protein
MGDSWSSKVAWDQLRCATGDSSREVGELLQLLLAGEDVWGELIGLVLHQETLWEATVPVAAWMVEALQTGRLGNRPASLTNPSSGQKYIASERALVLELLTSMAEAARDAVSSGSRSPHYTVVATLVLEALRPGISLYEAWAEDCDDLLDALADEPVEPSDSQYARRLRAKLGMPSTTSTRR